MRGRKRWAHLDGGEAHAADHRDQAEPLVLGDLLSIESGAHKRGKGGLGGLHDPVKRKGRRKGAGKGWVETGEWA